MFKLLLNGSFSVPEGTEKRTTIAWGDTLVSCAKWWDSSKPLVLRNV